MNGTLTSNVTINKDGTLAGGKNVVGNVKNDGGHIAPGNSIGTLTIDGDLTMAKTSDYVRSDQRRHERPDQGGRQRQHPKLGVRDRP